MIKKSYGVGLPRNTRIEFLCPKGHLTVYYSPRYPGDQGWDLCFTECGLVSERVDQKRFCFDETN